MKIHIWKNIKWEELYKKCLGKRRILYAITLAWIAVYCFLKRFFTKTSRSFRYRSVVVAGMTALAAVLLFWGFRSSMNEREVPLSLLIDPMEAEVEEGYSDDVSCRVVLENTGEYELEDVSLAIGSEQEGFSLVFRDEEETGDSLPAGEKWTVDVVMAPGREPGKYLVTVLAEAEGIDGIVEQTVCFVVKKKKEEPEVTAEPSERPEPTETVEPSGEPEAEETAEPSEKPSEKPEPEVTAEPSEKPDLSGESGSEETPQPAYTPKAERTVTPEQRPETAEPVETPEAAGIPWKAQPAPYCKRDSESKPKSGQEEKIPEDKKEDTVSSSEMEDVICVDVPARVHMLMNPMASGRSGQISSKRFPLKNRSAFPVEVKISETVLNVRQNSSGIQKECSLNIDIWKQNAVILAIRNLRKGSNPLDASFYLEENETAYIRFSGSLDKGTEYLWENGDLTTKILFEFKKKGGAWGISD